MEACRVSDMQGAAPFPLEWCGWVGTFLSRAALTPNQFIFPSPWTHLAGRTGPRPTQTEAQKEEEERRRTIYQKPRTSFFKTKKTLPVRISLRFPCDIPFH